jgi:hypothetical protein
MSDSLRLAAGSSYFRNHFLLNGCAIFVRYLKQADAALANFCNGIGNVEVRERRNKLPPSFVHLPDFVLLKARHVPSEKRLALRQGRG